MERNLDIENFERLLKDRSDEFKMYPEKRVWHSIYNNIHPGRKWPSVAMSITLIATLLITGYLNTDNKNNRNQYGMEAKNGQTTQAASTNIFYGFLFNNAISTTQLPILAENTTLNFVDNFNTYKSVNTEFPAPGQTTSFLRKDQLYTYQPAANNTSPITVNFSASPFTQISLAKSESVAISTIKNDIVFPARTGQRISSTDGIAQSMLLATARMASLNILPSNEEFDNEKNISTQDDLTGIANNTAQTEELTLAANTISTEAENKLTLTDEDKAWIENYAMYNRPAPKKWAGKLSRQTYITPSVVYRQLRNAITTSAAVTNNDAIQHPSFGFEVGTGITYAIFKGVKLKASLQLNYTRYNSQAFTNSHPLATTITLVSEESGQPYPAYRSTSYSNVDGISSVKLHNETFQLSLPVGMDFKIAGNDNLQWNIGATIQPTYVVGGKSFLLSSDKRNYIKETSLLNRWNLNAGFETFVSYKTENGITFQFGPQFRQQLFNTNRQYIIQEKLNNYGFKFGITKLIK